MIIEKEKKIDILLRGVANFFGLEVEDIKKKRRKREIVMRRQAFHYYARKYLPHSEYSLAYIGAYSGGYDHATVLHSVRTMTELMETDKQWRLSMSELDEYLKEKVVPRIKTLRPEDIPVTKYQKLNKQITFAQSKSNKMYYLAKKYLLDLEKQVLEDKVIEGWRAFELQKELDDVLRELDKVKLSEYIY